MNSFFIALQFLTRLKVVNQIKWTEEEFGKSVTSFPIVGLVIGLFTYAFYYVLQPFFPIMLLALLVVVFDFLFTGGLHADGFMDTCDGLFSGRDKERKLEIMKDSRVGSNGVVGFVFLILLKWQLLAHLPHQLLPMAIIALPILSRFGLVMSIKLFPYARPEGMGKAFAVFAPTNVVAYGAFMALIPMLLFGFKYLILYILTIAINQLLNRYNTKHLGGVTGDTYGFVVELTELFLLLSIFFIK